MTTKQGWKLFYKTANPLEASMIQGLLEENAIAVVLMNRQDRNYPLVGGELELYVPVHLEHLARSVVGGMLLN